MTSNNQSHSRFLEVDYLKAICLIGMVAIHVYEELHYVLLYSGLDYVNPVGLNDLEGIYSLLVELFGAVAPAFMICLGMGLVFTRHSSPRDLAWRAVKLFILAYILRLVIHVVEPGLVELVTGEPGIVADESISLMFVDILNFAWMAFLFFALAKKLKLSDGAIVAIAVAMMCVSYLAPTVGEKGSLIQYVVGHLFYQSDLSCFPLFQWLVFPVFGYILAKRLTAAEDRGAFHRKLASVAMPLLVVYTAVLWLSGYDLVNLFTVYDGILYDMDLIRAAWYILLVSSQLSILYWISTRISGTRISNLGVSFGRDLTTMYMAQWYIVGFLLAVSYVIDFTPLSISGSIVTTILVVALTYVLSEWYLKHVKHRVPLLKDL